MSLNRIAIVACLTVAALDSVEGFTKPGAWALLAAILAFNAGLRVGRP